MYPQISWELVTDPLESAENTLGTSVTAWNSYIVLMHQQNHALLTQYTCIFWHSCSWVFQICLTLSHLATLATTDDLTLLHDALVFHLDTLQHHLLKFHERVVPEKAEVLAAATNHATYLLQLPGLTFSQHSAAALLVSMFLQDSDQSLQHKWIT
jgi:hypothetical protein